MSKKRPQKKCSFCSKTAEHTKRLIAGSGNAYICDVCVALCGELCEDIPTDTGEELIAEKYAIPTPIEIHRQLNEYVIGQTEAKKSLSVAAYNHYKRIADIERNFETRIQKSNILLLGASGTGKTFLAQIMAKILQVPFAIADATSLTEAGYVGEDVETVLQKLLQAANGDIAQAERGIVFIDEIDKIARSTSGAARKDVGGASVQHALLKMIEGTVSTVPTEGTCKSSKSDCVKLDTTNILFICGGAFAGIDKLVRQRLNSKVIGFTAGHSVADGAANIEAEVETGIETEDLQQFGLIPELIGRLPVIVSLSPLDEPALVSILTEPKDAITKQYKDLLKMDGVTLEFADDALAAIAKQAIERKTGARGLRTILEAVMREIMYEIPSNRGRVDTVTITKEAVMGNKRPIMANNQEGVFV